METDTDTSYDRDSDSTTELHAPRRPRKGGRHVREEPTSLTELQACPLAMAFFREQSCYQYFEMIARTHHHQELARLFVLHLHDGQLTLDGVNFTLTLETISQATRIPNVGKQWNKRQQVDRGTRPMQDKGPSGFQDTDFILIDEDLSCPSSKLRDYSGAEGRDRYLDSQVAEGPMDDQLLGAVKQIVGRSAYNHGVEKHP